MQKYLPRDLTRLVREYVSDPREDYGKVVEKIHGYNLLWTENLADSEDGIRRIGRITFRPFGDIRSTVLKGELYQHYEWIIITSIV